MCDDGPNGAAEEEDGVEEHGGAIGGVGVVAVGRAIQQVHAHVGVGEEAIRDSECHGHGNIEEALVRHGLVTHRGCDGVETFDGDGEGEEEGPAAARRHQTPQRQTEPPDIERLVVHQVRDVGYEADQFR